MYRENVFLSNVSLRNSFCDCRANEVPQCNCASVEGHEPHWRWSETDKTPSVKVVDDKRGVIIHEGYSRGTGCVRGDTPMIPNRCYYWEIKFNSKPYGTSMMIGVGTDKFLFHKYTYFHFENIIGSDSESWGLDYRGLTYENNQNYHYFDQEFTLGSVVGVYLDLYAGVLAFYLNREPLGVAFTSLQGKTLYPFLSSTSAFTSFYLIYACSYENSLFTRCLRSLPATQWELLPPRILEEANQFAFWNLSKSKKKSKESHGPIRVIYENNMNSSSYIYENSKLIHVIKTPKRRRFSKHFM